MIVFGRYYDESVATLDGRRELWVLHLLACVIEFHWKLAHVDQLRLDIRAFLRLLKNKTRSVFTSPSLPGRSKNHWNKKWPFHFSLKRLPGEDELENWNRDWVSAVML